MIEIKNLYKRFGDKQVYNNADITVDDSSICGLIGINGAGKSTLLRILSGVIRQDAGTVSIDGEEVFENEKIKRDILFLSDDPYYDTGVTGLKLKELYKTFYSLDDEIFTSYIRTFNLDVRKPIRNFSKGMKRQLFVAIALACEPKYLFLDESFDGLDPLARLEFKRGLIALQEKGSTIVIASHSLRELEDICDSFVLIDNTAVKVSGKIEEALDNIFKLQLAFEKDIPPEDLPVEYIRAEKVGRVMTVVVRGNKEEALQKIKEMKPVILEEISMDFEDMFIEEVQNKGYLR
ncbi:MAG: ABC transporter ATP-binding protein [Clostridia bacterium]|nr:ABC transporter ATP-binding protein [Clostridia bacterium]